MRVIHMKYRVLLKTLLTVLMIAAAGFAALFIKDKIDSGNPEYALPIVTVNADGADVPVFTAGFDWRFLFSGSIKKDPPDVYEMPVSPAAMIGGEILSIDYSVKPDSVVMKRTDSYSYSFFETDNLNVPTERGGYLYELDIQYPRGTEICYFYIIVD